ncbi:MAG: RNA polymerase sigma-70 factor, partial [Gemmatimonadetes bacterium]|nr:RNA polymerase sigma-70 factor [Gemmatimonadota bacterium]
MLRLADGDSQALETALTRYWPALVAYASTIVGHRDSAEDIVQEAFIRLWEKRRTWKPVRCLKPLLLRIARNLAVSERRRQRVLRAWAATLTTQDSRRGSSPSPMESMEAEERERAFARAIEDLPPRRREVFTLSRFQQLSYREIAEVMGISQQTVANQMSAALAELRRALRPHLEEPVERDGPAALLRRSFLADERAAADAFYGAGRQDTPHPRARCRGRCNQRPRFLGSGIAAEAGVVWG